MALPPMPASTDLDSDHLGRILKVLGNPVRLDILKALRAPTALSEIQVRPRRRDGRQSAPRSMNRVSVRGHLDQLIEIGAVRILQGHDGARDRYQVDHRQLFALSEELRILALLRPIEDPEDATRPEQGLPEVTTPKGPHLVLVNGMPVGAVISLDGNGDGPWLIGRSREAAVSLDYDPYVSLENATLHHDPDKGLVLADMRTARNGTTLNGGRLARGGSVVVRHGDLIGVGRSLLLYRED